MRAIAKAKYVRTSPRKARLVIDEIRGKSVQDALAILKFTPNKAARLIEKVVLSAVANAENNHHMNGDALKVAVATVDGGPLMKRLRYAPMGRGYMMKKRFSHITIELEETEPKSDATRARRRRASRVQKAEAPATKPVEETVKTEVVEATEQKEADETIVESASEEVVAEEETTVDTPLAEAKETESVEAEDNEAKGDK
ncbi:MAG: 50S ribosomal protein L22 [Armatimonadota bacterium]